MPMCGLDPYDRLGGSLQWAFDACREEMHNPLLTKSERAKAEFEFWSSDPCAIFPEHRKQYADECARLVGSIISDIADSKTTGEDVITRVKSLHFLPTMDLYTKLIMFTCIRTVCICMYESLSDVHKSARNLLQALNDCIALHEYGIGFCDDSDAALSYREVLKFCDAEIKCINSANYMIEFNAALDELD